MVKNYRSKATLLWRIRNSVGRRGRELIYHALVGSILNYVITLLGEIKSDTLKQLQVGQNIAMRYILGWDRESRILDMLKELDWLCMELFIKSKIFLLIFKLRKGIIEGMEEEKGILRKSGDRNLRNSNKVMYHDNKWVDGMIFYKGLRDYLLFGCDKWEQLEVGGFKKKLKAEFMKFQENNWGDGTLRPKCYRWREFGL